MRLSSLLSLLSCLGAAACVSATEADMLAQPVARSATAAQRLLTAQFGAEALGISARAFVGDAEKFFANESAALGRMGASGERLLGDEVDRVTTLPTSAAELLGAESERFAVLSLQPLAPQLDPETAARRTEHLVDDLVPVLRLDHRPLPELADPEHRTSLEDDRPVPSLLERVLRRIWH